MLVAFIVFFILGFSRGGFPFEGTVQESGFMYSWIAFPVAGVLSGIVVIIFGAFKKSKEEIIAEAQKENPWLKVDAHKED